MSTVTDQSLLAAALEGLESKRSRLEEQIKEVRRMLGSGSASLDKPRRGRPPGSGKKAAAAPVTADGAPRKRRKLSVAARKRIAAAQKKRWANYHKESATTA